jgi:alginate production protein
MGLMPGLLSGAASVRTLTVLLTLPWLLAPGPLCPPSSAERVFDPEDPPETRYRLTPSLSFGADIEIDYSWRRNHDLDDHRRDDVSLLTPELSLAWSFDPAPTSQGFLNVALGQELVLTDSADNVRRKEDFTIEVKEAYLRVGRLAGGPSVQIGRQRFDDERKWLYDEDLDALRLRYVRGTFAAELSASRNGVVRKKLPGPDDRERINNYMLHAIYALRDWVEVEGYAIVRDDRTADRHDPVFLGVRSRGEPVEDLDYWLELGYVGGRDGSKSIGGWGVDLGTTYEWPLGPRPSVTLGFAFGSGDRNTDDQRDGSFRQTGLQKNEWDFGGSTDFKVYGEVLDPELSNLAIFTVGAGVRPGPNWSVDLVYHDYRQHHASPTLRHAAIDAEPSGRRRRLGSEIDLVVGVVEILDRLEVKAVVGHFFPGAAFPGGTGAWGVGVEAQFRF